MKTELAWLLATVVMTALFWIPYVLNRMAERGLWATFANPNMDQKPKALWAGRMINAHKNAVENLVIFAPLVLALEVVGVSTSMTVTATMVYFWTRLIHFVAYTLGIPVLRTLAFVVGFACQMVLAYILYIS